MSMKPSHLKFIKEINYIPVGLGTDEFSKDWVRDNTGDNITEKNKYYGEYTFHYWFWKNKIDQIQDNTWIGFCAYRRFWLKNNKIISQPLIKDFLVSVPNEWKNYDTIIGQQYFINKMKISKLIKHGLRSLINYPQAIFEKNRNIKFQFNTFHGFGTVSYTHLTLPTILLV